MHRRFVFAVCALFWLWMGMNGCEEETGFTETLHPIVLAHGAGGFDELFGVVEYWNGITSALEADGATVYVTTVSQFNATELRGGQLISQLDDIRAITGDPTLKFNLIGHSHGGLDIRYVAATRPDLVASVTSVATPHQGAELADFFRDAIQAGTFLDDLLTFFGNLAGQVLGMLAGTSDPQDAQAMIDSLTSDGLAVFNASYPQGLPPTPCAEGPAVVNGIRYYSWTGTGILTNALDLSDPPLALTTLFYSEANDGLVGRCSSHLGDVIRDDYFQNHLDEVNLLFGLVSLFDTDPVEVFRQHANRLKNAGL